MDQSLTWTSEKRKISELIPASYNPRRLTEKQAKELNESIEKFDLVDPVIVNHNNIIIGGHQRIKILSQRGVKEVDVRIPNRVLTENEERELNLRLNKNLGEWDLELLAGFDLEMLQNVGFTSDELDAIFKTEHREDEDEVPHVRPETTVRPGDLYVLGDHMLLCGDSTSQADVSRLMGPFRARMVFTDPPYNVNYKSDDGKSIENDSMSGADFAAFVELFTENLLRFCDGALYVCMSSSEWHTIQGAFKRQGGHLSRIIIWVKNHHVLSRGDYHGRHEPITVINDPVADPVKEGEPILYGYREGAKRTWNGGRKQTDIWEIDRPVASKEHPTMKPVELCERAIRNSSNRGDVVLDLFGGSGSTLIAAEKSGRRCFMNELDPVYCQVILDRWEKFAGKKALLIDALKDPGRLSVKEVAHA